MERRGKMLSVERIGVGTIVLLIVLLIVLIGHLGPVVTWLTIGLAVALGLFGVRMLDLAARFRRWRRGRDW